MRNPFEGKQESYQKGRLGYAPELPGFIADLKPPEGAVVADMGLSMRS